MKNKFSRRTVQKREKNKEFLKMKQKNQRYFCNFSQKKTKRQFLKRPKKKIDKRKSRTVISKKNATNQKKKHGTHKATARRKEEKTRDLPEMKAGFQKDGHKFVKNEHFWQQKIR